MKKNKKLLVALLALVLTLICICGTTLAWLLDTTDPVTNTFTTSDVSITLTEDAEEFKMIPGYTIEKDPVVTVKAVSEKCYVFVKVEKSNNFDDFMTYAMADGWTELTENSGVFYRVVENTDADQDFAVIKDNKVAVKEEVTKQMMNALTEETRPTLTFTAYACQYMKNNTESFTADEAWANVPKN